MTTQALQGHTPGPWVCHSGSVYKDGPTVWPQGDDVGIPIARMDREPGNGTTPTERDANARLIAAAPAMLEALQTVTYILGKATPDNCERQAWDAWQTASAAIAQATG